ncbi:hypothetical protein AAAT03_09005 [Collinsella sp. CLA-AA-H167]|uniref:hypothetical protein n=1 Tax=Collinsella sp. CLA-AA-H167 TaxID=3136223 RepID=UPI0032C15C39
MNDSSQIIYNVKKTATRIIQEYLKLWVKERCPDSESWTRQVESICDEARRRGDENPRFKPSYDAVTAPLDRVGLEKMDMGSWDLTALRTIVLHIHSLGIWLSKEQYELFVKIVDDKNYDSHESTNEPMEYVKPWSCEALDRMELFAKSANGSLQEDHYKEYFEESIKTIQETRKRNREEYDARYGQIAELKRQAETEAHDIATSRDPLNAYGAAFPKWICKLPNDSRASFHLRYSFNEALVAEGFTLAASNLADTYYSGDEITPVDYEKAAYYFEKRGVDDLMWYQRIQYAGIHLRGLISNASADRGNAILSEMESPSMKLCLAREYLFGRWIPKNYAKAAALYEASPTKRATPESNSSIMMPQDYANLASLYLAELANEPSPGKGSEIIAALEDALRGTDSTLQAYQNEDGFTFYRVITAGGKSHRKTQG